MGEFSYSSAQTIIYWPIFEFMYHNGVSEESAERKR